MSKRRSDVFEGRDVVSIDHFSNDEILYILKKAKDFKDARARGKPIEGLLEGKVMTHAFFEPSTRTCKSFVQAALNQGMKVNGFDSPEGTSFGAKKESMYHTFAMFKEYGADVFVTRTKLEGAPQYIADRFDIPVISGGDGRHEHPTQTMLDLFTILETQDRLKGLKVAFVGDRKNGRTVHSLLKGLRRFEGNEFYDVGPEQLALPAEYVEGRDDVIRGISLEEAVKTCDIVYMTRIQLERIDDPREKEQMLGSVRLTADMLKGVKGHMKVLHPLPINAEAPEIESPVERTPFAYYIQQAGNGVPVREAILCAVLGALGNFKGKPYQKPSFSDKAEFIQVPIGSKGRKKDQKFIYSIKNGTVIDHIPQGAENRLADALGVPMLRVTYVLAGGLSSAHTSSPSKGMIKLVDYNLTSRQNNVVAFLSPNATISVIKDHKVSEKYHPKLPDRIDDLFECSNQSCVSRSDLERLPSTFLTISRDPAVLSCYYCETPHTVEKGKVKPK